MEACKPSKPLEVYIQDHPGICSRKALPKGTSAPADSSADPSPSVFQKSPSTLSPGQSKSGLNYPPCLPGSFRPPPGTPGNTAFTSPGTSEEFPSTTDQTLPESPTRFSRLVRRNQVSAYPPPTPPERRANLAPFPKQSLLGPFRAASCLPSSGASYPHVFP